MKYKTEQQQNPDQLISWLLQKPTDLGLHCLQRQDISGFSRIHMKCQDVPSILNKK